MSKLKIRKAVIPAAGLGTRMLPATKAIPKEMLPVFDKPLIHYAVRELFNAGIESILIVTGLGKHVIENHFARDSALEQELIVNKKIRELENIKNNTPVEGSIAFVRQSQRLGLWHAVWCARKWIEEEPFFVSTPDELLLAENSCIQQMLNAYHKINNVEATIIAAMEMEKKQTQHYGVLEPIGKPENNQPFQVKGLVEKPKPEDATSNLCSIGRYILPAGIMNDLENAVEKIKQKNNNQENNNQENNSQKNNNQENNNQEVNKEIQLTDLIASRFNKKEVFGCLYKGERYDCGKIGGWVAANVAIAKQQIEKQKNGQQNGQQNEHWQQTIDALDKIEQRRP